MYYAEAIVTEFQPQMVVSTLVFYRQFMKKCHIIEANGEIMSHLDYSGAHLSACRDLGVVGLGLVCVYNRS